MAEDSKAGGMDLAAPGLLAKAVGSTLAVQALVVMASLTLPVAAPVAAASFGIDAHYIGYYASLVFLGGIPSALITPLAVRRMGALRLSQLTLLAAAFGLISLLFGWWPLALLSGVAIGFGYGPANPSSSHLLARLAPPHLRGRVFSLKQVSVPLGGAMAGLLVPILIALGGWRLAVIMVALACTALAFGVQRWRERFDDDRQPGAGFTVAALVEPIRLLIRYPRLLELGLASMAFSALQFCFSSVFVTFLTHQGEISLDRAGSTLSIALAASVVARLFWGWLADRLPGLLILALLGLAMTAIAVTASTIGPSWPFAAVIGIAVLFGATAFSWNGVYLAEVAQIAPPGAAMAATAGTMCLTFTGGLCGPTIFSTAVGLTGDYGVGFQMLGLFTALAGFACLRSLRRS